VLERIADEYFVQPFKLTPPEPSDED